MLLNNLLDFAIKRKPNTYHLSFESFYNTAPTVCEEEISQLIRRYKIYQKKILSVGAGTAHEEYWLAKKGQNLLTLIDIDEHKTLEDNLKRIAINNDLPKSSDNITYYICDFLKCKQDYFIEQFDILYYSSFTPDELRRGKIMKKTTRGNRGNNLNWPAKEKPLHPIIEKSLEYIKKDGLFILQSYCTGIDLQHNPGYIQNLQKQLLNNGIKLIDIYCLTLSPGVNLFVGYKGNNEETILFYKEIKENEIGKIHGRTTLENNVNKIFSLL